MFPETLVPSTTDLEQVKLVEDISCRMLRIRVDRGTETREKVFFFKSGKSKISRN